MKALSYVAAIFTILSLTNPVTSRAAECAPDQMSTEMVLTALQATPGATFETINPPEIKTFRMIISEKIHGVELNDFDQQVFALAPGQDEGVTILSKGGCVVAVGSLPVALYKDLMKEFIERLQGV